MDTAWIHLHFWHFEIETIFPRPKNSHLLIAIHFYRINNATQWMTDEGNAHTIKTTTVYGALFSWWRRVFIQWPKWNIEKFRIKIMQCSAAAMATAIRVLSVYKSNEISILFATEKVTQWIRLPSMFCHCMPLLHHLCAAFACYCCIFIICDSQTIT